MTNPKTIRVEIDHARFWTTNHPVHWHVYVSKELRDAGIPVEGGLQFQSIPHGRLTMFNEWRGGKRICVYEWQPMPDEEDEEL